MILFCVDTGLSAFLVMKKPETLVPKDFGVVLIELNLGLKLCAIELILVGVVLGANVLLTPKVVPKEFELVEDNGIAVLLLPLFAENAVVLLVNGLAVVLNEL
jgi:hypothetical protein